MLRFGTAVVAALLLSPVALAAQESPIVSSLKGVHEVAKGYILRTAEMLSQELYGYQPTPEVRTAGKILAHVADSQYFFCSTAAGEASPQTASVEETVSAKADIVAALEKAFAYCDGVYAGMTAEKASTMVDLFGMQMAAAAALSMNTAHNYEHYGNLVTYMRLNGITPPSSM